MSPVISFFVTSSIVCQDPGSYLVVETSRIPPRLGRQNKMGGVVCFFFVQFRKFASHGTFLASWANLTEELSHLTFND